MDEYERIRQKLDLIEQHRLDFSYLDWCASRIDWAWKWRKLTRAQMEELAQRVVDLYEKGE